MFNRSNVIPQTLSPHQTLSSSLFTTPSVSHYNLNMLIEKNINIGHINAQSLACISHFDEIYKILNDNKNLHILAISETWLNATHTLKKYKIPGYKLIRSDRTRSSGGGVALYIRENLKPIKLAVNDPSSGIEFLFAEITTKFNKMIIAGVYRPPNINYRELDTYFDILSHHTLIYKDVISMGDLNCNMLLLNPESSYIKEKLELINLTLVNSLATHFQPSTNSQTQLDLAFTAEPKKVVYQNQIAVPGLSYHDMIYLSYNVQPIKSKKKEYLHRDFKNVNYTDMFTELGNIDWTWFYNASTLNEKSAFFNYIVNSFYDQYVPLKSSYLKHRPQPWMNDTVTQQIKLRDKAFEIWRQNRHNLIASRVLHNHYVMLRNSVKNLIKNEKRKYFEKQFLDQSVSKEPKKFWNIINSTGTTSSANKPKINNNLFSPEQINNFFTQASENIANNPIVDHLEDAANPTNSENLFNFNEIYDIDTLYAINNIKSNAIGEDCISIKFLKKIIQFIIAPLTHLINTSLKEGSFANIWKKSIVCPIPKVDNPKELNELRPISVTPAISKIVEKIVHRQLILYLKRKSLLSQTQSGFRNGHSCLTALLKVSEDIRHSLDKKQVTIVASIDLSKAFDTIDISKLLNKLKRFNLSPLVIKWFSSYLYGRQQKVKLSNESSSWKYVKIGVPQGTILSPLLFSMFIDDISEAVSNSSVHLFADDILLYLPTDTKSFQDNLNKINLDLLKFQHWANENGLKINAKKTQSIVIGTAHFHNTFNLSQFKLKLCDTEIEFQNKIKYLGVIINKTLTWTEHINSIISKVNYSLRSLYCLKHIFPLQIKNTLIKTLIMPIFDYCDVVYNAMKTEDEIKLQKAHNSCIRFVTNISYFDRITPHRNRLGYLLLKTQRSLHTVKLLHKILNTQTPNYLFEFFKFFQNIHNHSSRNNLRLALPHHKTTYMSNSFTISGARIWNSLLPELQSVLKTEPFGLKLRTNLFNQQVSV